MAGFEVTPYGPFCLTPRHALVDRSDLTVSCNHARMSQERPLRCLLVLADALP
jgi:hypothetical protein